MFEKVQVQLNFIARAFGFQGFEPKPRVYLYRAFGLIFLGIMSRLLPHLPNFTAMNAIALFSTCFLGGLSVSFFTVYASLLLGHFVFGLDQSAGYVYFSLGLMIFMGRIFEPRKSTFKALLLMACSTLLFFIVTNFGVWSAGSIYPKSAAGLQACYLAALPFLMNDLMGTFFYGGALFMWLAHKERQAFSQVEWTRDCL